MKAVTVRGCVKCNKIKRIEEFNLRPTSRIRDSMCTSCRDENNRNWKTITPNNLDLLKKGKIECFACGKIKVINEYRKNNEYFCIINHF